MDTSKAAAVLGRLGGKAGRGASQRRGGTTPEAVSAHMRAIRAKRPKAQVYERRDEWGGYTVREGLKGWIVEEWSRISGQHSGVRFLVPYCREWPRETRLDALRNTSPGASTEAEAILVYGREHARILRAGHIVF